MTTGQIYSYMVASDYPFVVVCEICGIVNECVTYNGARNSLSQHRNTGWKNQAHLDAIEKGATKPPTADVFRAREGRWAPSRQTNLF